MPRPLPPRSADRSRAHPFVGREGGLGQLLDAFAAAEAGRLRLEGTHWQLDPGTDAASVPGTIQQVLMERIDRLDDPARHLLQIAAVIGRTFAKSVLAELEGGCDDKTLRQLLEAEFVQLEATRPEPLFRFKHALIQEVAYASLLQRTRRLLHRRVAAVIETRHGRRLDDHHATLGHHLAAAEEWQPAARHLERAAERALEAAAPADALALLEHAIECHTRADASDRALAVLQARRATVLQALSRVADAHAAAARAADLARTSDSPEIEGMAQAQMGLASFYLHAFPRARTEARRAIALGEIHRSTELLAAGGWLATGDPVLACEIAEKVLGVVRSPATSDFMRWRYAQHLFACLGEARQAAGKPAEATLCADQCLDLATRTKSRKYLARGWRLKALTARARGDAEAAEEMLRRAVQHARAARNPGQIWRSELALGTLLSDSGKPNAARQRFAAARRCLAVVERKLEHPLLKQAFRSSPSFAAAFGEAGAKGSGGR